MSAPAADPRRTDTAFVEDVRRGLSRRPYALPPKYFYDALGSALFDAICRLPWYGLTRAETALIEGHAREIAALVQGARLWVELGPGSGAKLGRLVRAAVPARRRLHLVDVSAAALELARTNLEGIPGVAVTTDVASFEEGLARLVRPDGERALFLFLGSNIGNFDPAGARDLLDRVRGAAREGDLFLLGADLVKPEPDLLLAYDDPLGVTAAFNKNVLARINRELGADFDLGAFRHRALWNRAAARVEMHLESVRAQRVRIPAARLVVDLGAGETIWTESSHKFTPRGVATLLEAAGFAGEREWIEAAQGFALTLGTRRRTTE